RPHGGQLRAGLASAPPSGSRPCWRSCRRVSVVVGAAPAVDELRGIQPDQIGAQGAEDAYRVLGGKVPEQDHLAVVDRDDLDPVLTAAVGQKRGLDPPPRHGQLIRPVRFQRAVPRASAASSIPASPSYTSLPICTAGSILIPASRPRAHARSSAAATDPMSSARSTAVGCISQAAAAISTVSRSPRSRPPANAWRKAASE